MTWIYIVLCCLFNINYGRMVVQPTLTNDVNEIQEVVIEKKHKENFITGSNGICFATLDELFNQNTLYYIWHNAVNTSWDDIAIGYQYWVPYFQGNFYMVDHWNLPNGGTSGLANMIDTNHCVSNCTITIDAKNSWPNTLNLAEVLFTITLTSPLYTFNARYYYMQGYGSTPMYNETFKVYTATSSSMEAYYVYTDLYPSDTIKSFLSNPNSGTYQQGYDEGFNNGQVTGYDAGFIDGEFRGHQTGYTEGFRDGSGGQTMPQVIFAGILDVATIPVNVFLQMFQYEVFGINIAGLISGLITIALLIVLLRLILGRK